MALEQLERYPVLQEAEAGTTPADVYRTNHVALPVPRDEVYFTCALTSGGARSMYPDSRSMLANIPTIIRLNRIFAEWVAKESEHTLPHRQLTIPSPIGQAAGWHEIDYLTYWMYHLSGVHPDYADQFSEAVASGGIVNTAIFNDYTAPRERRVQEYDLLVDEYVDYLGSHPAIRTSLNPVSLIVAVPGHEVSVGSHAEKRLGRRLNIPFQEAVLNRGSERFALMAQDAPWIEGMDGVLHEDGAAIVLRRSGVELEEGRVA